jgi:hypothetical protein
MPDRLPKTENPKSIVINHLQSHFPSSRVALYFRTHGLTDESRIVPCQVQEKPLYPTSLATTETSWCYLPPEKIVQECKEFGKGPNLDRIMPLKMCSQLSLDDNFIKTHKDDQGRDWVWCPFNKFAPL